MFKRWFCKHSFIFVRFIHGDEIIHSNYTRTEWQCKHCGKVKRS